jgi:hypothetical protein
MAAPRVLYAWPLLAPYRSVLERLRRESDVVNALQHIACIAGDPPGRGAAAGRTGAPPPDGHLSRLHGAPRCDGAEAAWLGKGRGTVVRLRWRSRCSTGGDRLSVLPQPRAIHGEIMSGACRLWDYFRPTRAVLGRAFPSDGEQPMRQVLA